MSKPDLVSLGHKIDSEGEVHYTCVGVQTEQTLCNCQDGEDTNKPVTCYACLSIVEEVLEAQVWLPIEDAPKDGSWILGWDDDDELPVSARWTEQPSFSSKGALHPSGFRDVWDQFVSLSHFKPFHSPK